MGSYQDKPPLRTLVLWESIAFFYNDFYTTNQDGWITGADHTLHNPFFRTRWVNCVYQPSGSYGCTPRYIFYALTLFSIHTRKKSWVVSVALASVMLYSSTAAIHAVAAAVAALVQVTMRLAIIRENYEVVLIDKTSLSGNLEEGSAAGPIWLPVIPMVYETDANAVLAIVGFAFLFLLPMIIMSDTIRNVRPEQKLILYAWTILLFFGLVSAFLVDIYATMWSIPQLGFCPLNQTDPLPIFSNGPPSRMESWDEKDWYRWNRTIRDHFIFRNSSALFWNNCVYPCSEFSWPLRDQTDIIFVQMSLSRLPPVSYRTVMVLYIAACVLVGLFAGANLILSISLLGSASFRRVFRDACSEFYQVWTSCNHSALRRYGRPVAWSRLLTIVILAEGFSIIGSLFFVAVKEYSIWWAGFREESFQHIGQWGILVSTVLLFGAVWWAQRIEDSLSGTEEQNHNQRPPNEPLNQQSREDAQDQQQQQQGRQEREQEEEQQQEGEGQARRGRSYAAIGAQGH